MLDVIGMVLYVSSMGQKDSDYNRKIPVRNIVLMDGTYVYMSFKSYYLSNSKFIYLVSNAVFIFQC